MGKTKSPLKKAALAPHVQAPAPPAPQPAGLVATLPPVEYRGRLPVNSLRPCPFNVRKTIRPEGVAELAASFREHGVLQDLLVRPVGTNPRRGATRWEGVEYWEVVDGHRRLLAAQQAELPELPVVMRFLTDVQVRVIMLLSLEQREDVAASEKAAAYAELVAGGRTAEDVARETGKSVAYVRDLVRLARLPAWALAAVDAGTLPRATAGLVARVPGEESRRKAAACVLLGVWTPGELREDDLDGLDAGKTLTELDVDQLPLTFRDTKDLLATHFTRQLKGAPFSRKALDLVPAAGSCDACPKLAGNDPEAKADGVRADVCLDPDCYRAKLDAHDEQERARFRKRYKLAADADVNPDGAALAGERPARGWLDWNGPVGGSELAEELHPKLATRKVSEVVLECPVVHGCGVNLVLDDRHRPRVLVKTADARRTLTAAGVIKKPERKPKAEPRVNTATAEWMEEANRKPPPGFTQDEWDRVREKGQPAEPAAEKPLLTDALEVEERAAAIACRVLGEYAGEQCELLDDVAAVPDADHGGPIHDALRFVARFLVHDHFEFGSERAAAVRAALDIGDVSPSHQAKEQAEAAISGLSSSKLLALCVRLAAHPLLLDDHAEPLPQDMLAWAELDWPNLTDQARREMAGEPTADERLAAAEAATEPAPPADAPAPIGTMLQDLDVPAAALDALDARQLYAVAEAWAACQSEIDPCDRDLPPRQQLAAWLKRLGVKARPADQAAEAIAKALPGDDGKAVAS